MSSGPHVGRQARNLNALGRTLAEATRRGMAPNQCQSNLRPPASCPVPKRSGELRPDGKPLMQNAARFQGANSIALRLDAMDRGTTETRYATVLRAQINNRAYGVTDLAVVRDVSPGTGQPPKAVELNSQRSVPVAAVHLEDGQGFGPGGKSVGQIDVRAGDPVYGQDGQHAPDTYELASTYVVYNVEDLKIEGLAAREHAAPVASAPESPAAEDRRIALVVKAEVVNLIRDLQSQRGVVVQESVRGISDAVVRCGMPPERLELPGADNVPREADFPGSENAERQVRFSGAQGSGPAIVIECPVAAEFSDIHDQVSSITHAAAHAHLYDAAQRAGALGVEQGVPDQAAEARVKAYELEPEQRAVSAEYSKADLAATYATLNRVTAMSATYVPPPSTASEVQAERWAVQLEKPGGMAEVSRDVVTVEKGFADDRSVVRARIREMQSQDQEWTTVPPADAPTAHAFAVVPPIVAGDGVGAPPIPPRPADQPAH